MRRLWDLVEWLDNNRMPHHATTIERAIDQLKMENNTLRQRVKHAEFLLGRKVEQKDVPNWVPWIHSWELPNESD